MIDQKTIFMISILASGIGLLSGILIVYAHYLKIKRSFESRLLQAEKEWVDDLREVSVDELLQTKAGRELLSISIEELSEVYTRLTIPHFEIVIDNEQWLSIIKDKEWRHSLLEAFIVQNVIYSARTTFLSRILRSIFAILNFFGFLTQIGVAAPGFERDAEAAVRERIA